MTIPTTITSEVQKLAPSAIIELFELDTTTVGGILYRFHSGKNGLVGNVVWQGNTYTAWPINASGFEQSGRGSLPRPKVVVSNVAGSISALVLQYNDLVGCKVTRIRTLQKYLDTVNFTGSVNPTADSTAEYPRDIYFIDRKSGENREMIEFELAAAIDLAGIMIPRRQVVQNYCRWKYRGADCGYAGTSYFDVNDASVGSLALDVCGHRLSSCRKRFSGELPFGGFPAAGLIHQ